VALIVDAGPVVALADRNYPRKGTIRDLIEKEPGPVILSSFAAAEADHLILTRFGHAAERLFLRDLASGTYDVQTLSEDEHQLVVELDDRYPGLGLTDLSIIVLAARYRTRRLVTFDHRDFRRVRALDQRPFTLLPADLEAG
jgi:predicted nucleic acid-binding protein